MTVLRFWFICFILLFSACTPISSKEPEVEVVTIQPTRDVSTPTASPTTTAIPLPDPTTTAVPSRTPTPEPTVPATQITTLSVDVSGQYRLWDPHNVNCELTVVKVRADAVDVELLCLNWAPRSDWGRAGHFVQTLPLEQNTAIFHTHQFADECHITFVFNGEVVNVNQSGSWVDCGFGGDVRATGIYARTEDAPVLNCRPDECEPTPFAMPAVVVRRTGESPVDTWTVMVEQGYFNNNLKETLRLRVAHTQNGTEWIAENVVLTDYYNLANPMHWSKDGRYLYFTHDSYGDACARPNPNTDMQRLDLATGEVVEIFPNGYAPAFSPDDQRLAYLSESRGLVIHNIADGHERETAIEIESGPDHVYLSQPIWSGDGQSLLIIAHLRPCESSGVRDGIVYVDANTLAQFTQVLAAQKISRIEAWPQWNMVLLSLSDEPEQGWLNLETGEFTAVSP